MNRVCFNTINKNISSNNNLEIVVNLIKKNNLPIILLNQNEEAISASSPALDILGYNFEELLKKRCNEIFIECKSSCCKKVYDDNSLNICEENIKDSKENIIRIQRIIFPINVDKETFLINIFIDIFHQKKAKEALKYRKRVYDELFNNMRNGVFVYKPIKSGNDFVIKDLNKAAEEIEKVNKTEIIGKDVTSIFAGIRDFGLLDVMRRVYLTGIPENHPVSYYNDGRINGWRRNFVYKNPYGEIVAVYEDATKEIKNKEKIRENEEKYHSLVNNASDAILLADESGKIIEANKAAQKLLGYSKEELLNLNYTQFHPEEEFERITGAFKEIMLNGYGVLNDSYTLTKRNEIIPVNITGSVINISGKKILQGIFHNISELKIIQEELRSSKMQLKNVIESAAEMIFSINDKGIINLWNKAIEEKTDFKKYEMVGKNVYEDNFPKEILPFINSAICSLEEKKNMMQELSITDRNNNPLNIIAQTSIIRGEENTSKGVVIIARKLYERNKIEKKIIPGHSYISIDNSLENLIDIINSFNKDKFMVFITRGNFDYIKRMINLNNKVLILSENEAAEGNHKTIIKPKELLEAIRNILKDKKEAVIVINNVSYLLNSLGFEKLISFFYELNDVIMANAGNLIINLSKESLSNKEFSIISEEFRIFPEIKEKKIHLDEKKIEALKFIYNKNSLNLNVPYNLIDNRFNLTRKTTKKWIDELQRKEVIVIKKRGRSKLIYITKKGKELINAD